MSDQKSSALRGVLWVVIIVSIAGNVVTSLAGMNEIIHLLTGIVCVGAVAGLIADHFARRRG